MSMNEYKHFLKRISALLEKRFNPLGMFYNEKIEKFIGFTDYETVLVEFEEFMTESIIAINFSRYTDCLNSTYCFTLPQKDKLYGHRNISYDHWRYYPEGTHEKTKQALDNQLDTIIPEMLESIENFIVPNILTDFPVDQYIIEKYEAECDELARGIHPEGYGFEDEWYLQQDDDVLERWTNQLADDEYAYITRRREELIPFTPYYQEQLKTLTANKKFHQEEVRKYFNNSAKFIVPSFKYFTIGEFLQTPTGKNLISTLKAKNIVFKANARKAAKNEACFVDTLSGIELTLCVADGLYWYMYRLFEDDDGMKQAKYITSVKESAFHVGWLISDFENGSKQVDIAMNQLKDY